MSTNIIQRRKTVSIAAAFAAAGASLLLAAPSASAAVSGLTVTPSAFPLSLAGTDYGTTCSLEMSATASAIGDAVDFEVKDAAGTVVEDPAVINATSSGEVVTSEWAPTATGTLTITELTSGETVTVEVANGIDVFGFVCIVLPA